MANSRARLVVAAGEGPTRVLRVAATAPQRWAFGRGSIDGWQEATHQLLGDGIFGGDVHRASIVADAGARLVVRAVAATPLRGGAPSAAFVHIQAGAGASVLYAPGALIPQRQSDHASVLRLDCAADGLIVAVTATVPGRSGMAERGEFGRLRLRTEVRVGKDLLLAEESALRPGEVSIDGAGIFAGAGVALSVIAVGRGAPAEAQWWEEVAGVDGVVGGATVLRSGGIAFRAICGSLGAAQEATKMIERRLRAG